MAFIEWTEELSVGINEIDEQHKKLIDMINRLHYSMLQNKAKEVQKEIIDEMVDYTIFHFETEEKYMHQFNYPLMEQHEQEHEVFRRKAQDLKERSDTEGFVMTTEILTFLKQWLQRHIMISDQKYAHLFIEKGVK